MTQCQKNVVRFLLIVAAVNAVLLFFRPDRAALNHLLHRYPPPRLAFCDRLVEAPGHLLPSWQLSKPWSDSDGNWAWLDEQDNVLLVVVAGSVETLRPGLFGFEVKVRDDGSVRLPRTKDMLVLVLPDGSVRMFAKHATLLRAIMCFLLADSRGYETPILDCVAGEVDPPEEAAFARCLAELRDCR